MGTSGGAVCMILVALHLYSIGLWLYSAHYLCWRLRTSEGVFHSHGRLGNDELRAARESGADCVGLGESGVRPRPGSDVDEDAAEREKESTGMSVCVRHRETRTRTDKREEGGNGVAS